MGNIVNTTHIGNIINSTGPFGTATEIKQTALGGVEITAGFGAWVLKMSTTGIEFGDAIGVNQIKMGLTGLTISSPKIDINATGMLTAKATGIATLESSAMTNVKGSLVMLN